MRFDHLSIRTRLLLCVVLPLVSSLLLGLLWLNTYVGRHDRMAELVGHTQTMRLASDLIDGLQAERGTTAGFIGSKGQKMASEMAAARQASDGAIARVATSELSHGDDLNARYAEIEAAIERIADIRRQVDTLTLPGGEAFSYYTDTIAMTMELSDRLGLGVRETELAQRLVAYADLLAAKEFAGRRRGLGTGAIGAGGFSTDRLLAFVDAAGGQASMLGRYMAHVAPEERQAANGALDAAGRKEIDALVDQMVERGTAGDLSSLDPAHFFSLATQEIKTLKGFEAATLNRIETLAAEAQTGAWTNLVQAGAIGFAGLLVVLAATVVFTRSITGPLKRLNLCMEKLARGEVDMSLIATGGRDEIARMARSVESFVQVSEDGVRRRQAADESVRRDREAERATHESERARKAREIAEAMEALKLGLKALSSGDVSYRISRMLAGELDQMRLDFNESTERLETALLSVRGVSDTVTSGVAELRTASNDLARRTETQAATVETTSAALAQIAETVSSNAGRADRVGRLVVEASDFANTSTKVVEDSMKAMEEIAKASKEISAIIGAIDEITFQTNLLALNAGVEAARAGEAGKGFAVVAQEVRELATRSADAAREIKELVARSVASVDQGVTLFGRTGEALNGILGRVEEVRGEMASIVDATREQASAIAHISSSIGEIDAATQSNAAMVEEAAAATSALGTEAERLAGEVAAFRLSIDHGTRHMRRAA